MLLCGKAVHEKIQWTVRFSSCRELNIFGEQRRDGAGTLECQYSVQYAAEEGRENVQQQYTYAHKI